MSEENVIVPGDVVRLKSGGPLMTVTGKSETVHGVVKVAWFGEFQADPFYDAFNVVALTKIDDDEAS